MKPFNYTRRIYFIMIMKSILYIACLFLLTNCHAQMNKDAYPLHNEETLAYIKEQNLEKYSFAVFASGCFWCVEPIFESVDGVVEAISGYSGGHTDYINYELSNTGKTGHAEAVKVYYDSTKVDFKELVNVFFTSHDYTQVNGQGPDSGPQYRSIAFYKTDEQKKIIEQKINEIEAKTGLQVVTEIKQFDRFFVAEDYHQNFKARNQNHPYIQGVSNPRFQKFKKKYEELKKEKE